MIDYDKYCVIDLETTAKESYLRIANPFSGENAAVGVISKKPGSEVNLKYNVDWGNISKYELNLILSRLVEDGTQILVGHNIAFDLLYFWNSSYSRGIMKFLLDGGVIWDTQIAEFYLSGQHKSLVFNSMDTVAGIYGLPQKPPIKEYLKLPNGEGFRNVPEEIREEYMRHDGNITEQIYLKQIEKAKSLGMLKLLQIHMEYRLGTVLAEYNGVYVNSDKCKVLLDEAAEKLVTIRRDLFNLIKNKWPTDKLQFNPSSINHIKACLFGHTFSKQHMLLEDGTWKMTGGKSPKIKEINTDPFYVNVYNMPAILNKDKSISMPTDVQFLSSVVHPQSEEFRQLLLEYRYYTKLEGTYIIPLLKNRYSDGRIRGQFNHSNTVTGRLSSSNPNLQNLHGDIKDIFTTENKTRWLAELDYSTIEVAVAGYVSGCNRLKQDLINGIDMHRLSASYTLNKSPEDVTDKERKAAKGKTFSWFYGAGKEKVGEDLFNYLRNTYNGIPKWQEAFYLDILRHEQVDPYNPEELGSIVQTTTGKRYWFVKYKTTQPSQISRGITHDFSSTERKDYPIQGESADLLAKATGKVFRYVIQANAEAAEDIILLLLCIHDSVVLEFKDKETMDKHLNNINDLLLGVVDDWKEDFGIEIDVPIKTEVKVSNESWGQCKKYELKP